MDKSIIKHIIQNGVVILFATTMVLVAECMGENEIIFPEILALLIGSLLTSKLLWNVSRLKMVIGMGLSAIIGIAINRYVAMNLYGKVILGLFLVLFVVWLLHTTMGPMISACILPIMIHTTSWIYPVSVIIMIFAIILIRILFEKKGLVEPIQYISGVDGTEKWYVWFKRFLFFILIAWIPIMLKLPYLIAPPLIVAYMECCNKKCAVRKRLPMLYVFTFLSGCIGVAGRLILVQQYGLPMFLSVMIGTVLVLLLMWQMKFYFPPIGAISMLPYILPSKGLILYPVEVLTGIIVLSGLAILTTIRKKNVLQ